MRRGEIWTVAGGKDCAGKPRPVVIVHDDRFDATHLDAPSRLMVDKITTLPKAKLGKHVGRLDNPDLASLNRAVVVFLGLAE